MVHQMDVKTAFLINENFENIYIYIYIEQPKGFVCYGHGNKVCKLKKSLYGLKQTPK